MKKLIPLLLIVLARPGTAAAQHYWQQRVDYTIDVTLREADRSLDGFIQIQYGNHSPDTLSFIWIHCWPNAYKNDRTAFSEQLLGDGRTDFYFSDKEQKGYINHLEFRVDGQLARTEDHPQYIDIIKVLLPSPLPPNGRINLTTPFHVRLPDNFSRGGFARDAYQITQWYPKPAVYDSRGWHPIPYLDQGEFYSEFGNFDVRITVPKSFVVAATGEWQDPSLRRQESGPPPPADNEPVPAVKKSSPSVHSSHPPPPKPAPPATNRTAETKRTAATNRTNAPAASQPEQTKTLHYRGSNIHDFAWFADRHFFTEHDTLQLASGRIIDVYSFYTPAATPAWRHSIRDMKDAVRFRSALIGEYPFNTVTAVETKMGTAGGMEYPMITSINDKGSAKELDITIEHEIGHNWFYAVLGTNERRYPWMDEGINTYYDNRYEAWKYPPVASPAEPRPSATSLATSQVALPAAPRANNAWLMKKLPANLDEVRINTLAAVGKDQPISTSSEDFTPQNYNLIAYAKTGLWMKLLEDSLGTPLFDSCMRNYFRSWQFKHPYPDDFRAVITGTSHRNLDSLFALLDKKGPLTPFPAHRRIQPTLLFNISHADKINYLNILPAIGFNNYDRVMVGLLIHNFNLPPERLRFLLAPLYATGSHQFNGLGHLAYSWYPGAADAPNSHHSIQQIEAGINGSRFSTISGTDSSGHRLFGGFYKLVPFVRVHFPQSSPRSTEETWVEWKTFLIGEKELNNYVQKSTDSLYYPTTGKYNFRYLNQLSLNIRDTRVLYPYSILLQAQQAAAFYRVNFTATYFFNYGDGGLDIRVFGAKFGYLGGRDPSQDLTSYEPKLTAVRGNEDYTYDNYFVGRNEFSGKFSQQIMMRDGGLKLRTDLFQGLQGRSDNWVASLNLSTTLPRQIMPEWIPLKIFLDLGTYAQAWQPSPPTAHFLYVGGLELNFFHDVIRFYAPLVYSSDFSNQLKTVPDQNGFFQKLSFSIDFQNINFSKIFGNTPF